MNCLKIILTVLILECYIPFFTNTLTIKPYEIRDLESTSAADFALEAANWTPTNLNGADRSSLCNNVPLLGGYGILKTTGKFRREYNGLPTHNSVHITVDFWLIDQWKLIDYIILTINGQSITFSNTIVTALSNSATWTGPLCGATSQYDLEPVQVIVQAPHVGSKLVLEFQMANFNSSNGNIVFQDQGFAGMRNVHILLSSQTLSSTYFCGRTYPDGLLYSNNCPCSESNFLDSNSGNCGGCDGTCEECFGTGSDECSLCKDGYRFDGTYCNPCHSSCKSCFGGADNQCDACYDGYTLDSASQCVPYCSSLLSPNNFLYPDGSCMSSCPSPMIITVDNNLQYCKYPCVSSSMYYYPAGKKCDISCPEPFTITPTSTISLCTYEVPQAVAAAIQIQGATSGAIAAGVVTMGAVSKGSQLGITVAVMAKMFQYIKYLNISYSPDLEVALETWNSDFLSFNLGPQAPAGLEEQDLYNSVPYVFAKYDVAPSFLVNYWDDLNFLALVIMIFGGMKALEIITKKIEKIQSLHPVVERFRLSVQTFLLILVYNSLGDIVLFSIIEYRSLNSRPDISKLSFSCSLIFIIIDFMILVFHFRLLRKYQKARQYEGDAVVDELNKKNKTAQALFKDYKDKSFGQQAFLLFFIGRDILFSIILATLFEHPLVQGILITLMNISMIVYMGSKRPLRDTGDEIQQLLSEVSLLAVNLNVLGMAGLDSADRESVGLRGRMSVAIIMVNVIFNFMALMFMIIKVVFTVRDAYGAWKNYKKQRAVLQRRVNVIAPQRTESVEQQSDTVSAEEYPKNTSYLQENGDKSNLLVDTSQDQFLNNSQSVSNSFVVDLDRTVPSPLNTTESPVKPEHKALGKFMNRKDLGLTDFIARTKDTSHNNSSDLYQQNLPIFKEINQVKNSSSRIRNDSTSFLLRNSGATPKMNSNADIQNFELPQEDLIRPGASLEQKTRAVEVSENSNVSALKMALKMVSNKNMFMRYQGQNMVREKASQD